MKYRHHLPQLEGELFLTDGGIETTLIFHEGLELPAFAAFDLRRHILLHRGCRRDFRAVQRICRRYRRELK